MPESISLVAGNVPEGGTIFPNLPMRLNFINYSLDNYRHMNEKNYNKTARWFVGHLYKQEGLPDIGKRLRSSKTIIYCKWSLEKGAKGNLHYQFLLNVNKPCRRSAIFKELNMIKGEWIEPCINLEASKNYVAKDDTHVEGPFEWNKERVWTPSVDYRTKLKQWKENEKLRNVEVWTERETIRHFLENKKLEIMFWMEYAENGNLSQFNLS